MVIIAVLVDAVSVDKSACSLVIQKHSQIRWICVGKYEPLFVATDVDRFVCMYMAVGA